MKENVLERNARLDTERKIADFRVKQQMDYAFKVKYAKIRAELKAKKDYIGLSLLPRDASPTRLTTRCKITGRRRAYYRRFQMSRMTFREHACMGLIPGVTKSSW